MHNEADDGNYVKKVVIQGNSGGWHVPVPVGMRSSGSPYKIEAEDALKTEPELDDTSTQTRTVHHSLVLK